MNIDGVDVHTASTTSISEVIVIDYIGSISPGTRTIRIDYYQQSPEYFVQVSRVYIITGVGVTTTTLSDLITITVTYQLIRSGDIRYSPGVRLFVYGNRRTTTTARLEVGSNSTTGRNQLSAGNDNTTPEVFLAIVTGSVTLQEGGEFTIPATLRGAVGASGDVIIVTRVLARAQLRSEIQHMGEVRVYERGVVECLGRALVVSVPGGSTSTEHLLVVRDMFDNRIAWFAISGRGSDVILMNWRTAVVTPLHIFSAYGEDIFGEAFLLWVQVVVWG